MAIKVQLAAGATEQAIQAALSFAPDGSIVTLAAGQTVSISQGLILDVSRRSITFDLNGSVLQQASDVSVLTVRGSHAPEQSAVLGQRGDAVTATYSGADRLAPGDWVKIYSDDVLPHDQGAVTRLGQAMQVAAVEGSTLLLQGQLEYAAQYQTNVRTSAFQSGQAVVTNGTIRGDQSQPAWDADLLQIRSAVGAQVDHLVVRDGNSTGINVVDGVNASILQSAAFNLSDDTPSGQLGYAIHSAGSFGTYINGLYAEDVRHAVDNNAVGLSATSSNPSKYGADLGLVATNVVVNGATATAFSWHSEGRGASIHDAVVINSWGVLGARGVSNSMYDVAGAYNGRGIQFYEYGEGDSRDIHIANVQMSDLAWYAFTTLRKPADNVISDSWFEVSGLDRFTFEGVKAQNTVVLGGADAHRNLAGGAMADRLLGTAAADTIRGESGDDYIWGGPGADRLAGGSGADRFAYYAPTEAGDIITDFNAAEGDVIDLSVLALRMGWRGDLIAGGFVTLAQSGSDTIVRILATEEPVDLVTILNASPAAVAARLSTRIVVTDHSDAGTGLPASSTSASGTLIGGDGNDLLFGTGSGDRLSGSGGDDRLFDLGGDAVFMGGAGHDLVSYRYANSRVTVDLADPTNNGGPAAGDRFSQIEAIEGSDFADRLSGNGGVNSFYGREGNDVILGGAGADYLDGGKGDDLLRGGTQNDQIYGREGSDRLYGDAGDDFLDGGAGSDVIYGGDGNDRFDDYGGADIFFGDGGSDVFVFGDPSTGIDTIGDFMPGKDRIEIGTSYLGLGSGTQLSLLTDPDNFPAEGPFLSYAKTSGELVYHESANDQGTTLFLLATSPLLTQADLVFM